MSNKENIFELNNVSISYKMRMFSLLANHNISIAFKRGKITALVGESGSGKTTLATALLNCVSEPGEITTGEVIFNGKDGTSLVVNALKGEQLRHFRWEKVSMVFQGSQSSLNPVYTIKQQFVETMKEHNSDYTKEYINQKCEEVLAIVNLDPDRILKMYPHELSGGMKQRVMIAFSLLLDPEFIILDEPTTALDVITQDYIFNILKSINQKMGISMLLLTHDIGIVSKYADYVGVMYAGEVVEYADVFTLFKKQSHPYTKGLIKATPSLANDISTIESIPGTTINLLDMPEGCPFSARCKKCFALCKDKKADLLEIEQGHYVRCHLYKEREHE